MGREQRRDMTRDLFIEAAKALVLEAGIEGVSVRKVGERTGFSYATIYNYFRDEDELLWRAAAGFAMELVGRLEPRLAARPFSALDVERIYDEYLQFFLERPKAFKLIFCAELGEAPADLAGLGSRPELAELLLSNLEGAPAAGLLRAAEVKVRARILTSSVHGSLLLHFSGKAAFSAEDLRACVRDTVGYLVGAAPRRGAEGGAA